VTTPVLALVSDQQIDRARLLDFVSNSSAGAIASFFGVVRDVADGKSVSELNYEAHPTAQSIVETIAKEVASKFDVLGIAVAHRFGNLVVGDDAFVAVTSAIHRAAALDACDELVERVKAEIPIWKHQVFSDGTDEWVNSA
jgi:molybdopterin synthase catalytic subunit